LADLKTVSPIKNYFGKKIWSWFKMVYNEIKPKLKNWYRARRPLLLHEHNDI
jgi:hypothetical protein